MWKAEDCIFFRYPLYQRGNPQQRIFLPNFWLKLVRPENKQPSNIVKFIVSLQMTKHDIKNYLEKIYKIPVVDVRTVVTMGMCNSQYTHVIGPYLCHLHYIEP
jgi:large subunit ribosomal protein L23